VKNFSLNNKVPVYTDLLHQIFLNILDNAVFELIKQASSPKRLLTITSCQKRIDNRDYAEIRIENSGSHIPQENLARVFDPFFTTKGPGEGTGLGLSIAFTLIKKHEGTISARNTREGVEFVLKFPMEVAPD
jgi:signal transduction histidine kinase